MPDYTYDGHYPLLVADVALNSDETVGPLVTITPGPRDDVPADAAIVEQADGQSPVLYRGDRLTLPAGHSVVSVLLVDDEGHHAGEAIPTADPAADAPAPEEPATPARASRSKAAPEATDDTKEQ